MGFCGFHSTQRIFGLNRYTKSNSTQWALEIIVLEGPEGEEASGRLQAPWLVVGIVRIQGPPPGRNMYISIRYNIDRCIHMYSR